MSVAFVVFVEASGVSVVWLWEELPGVNSLWDEGSVGSVSEALVRHG